MRNAIPGFHMGEPRSNPFHTWIDRGVLTERGAVRGVRTPYGDIECDYVVNCAGMWARQLGAKNGVNIPLQAAEHYYLITAKMEGIEQSWPVLEDPGSYGYFREEGGGLMVGMFEPVCAPRLCVLSLGARRFVRQ